MRDTRSLWVNCSAIISLLIASLGRHESKGSPGVTKSATLTHWPAFERRSLHISPPSPPRPPPSSSSSGILTCGFLNLSFHPSSPLLFSPLLSAMHHFGFTLFLLTSLSFTSPPSHFITQRTSPPPPPVSLYPPPSLQPCYSFQLQFFIPP